MGSVSGIIELQRGHDLPSQERTDGDVPIIGSFGITGSHDTAKYSGPGVAIGRSGAAIGTATYVSGPYWPLNTCLFVKDFKGNDERWVFHILDSMDFTAFNSGSAQPSLNRNFLRDIPVSIPPIGEQRAIAEVLGALDDKIAANTKLAATLEALLAADVEAHWLGLEAAAGNSPDISILQMFEVNPAIPRPREPNALYLDMKKLPESGSGISEWDYRPAQGGVRFMQSDSLIARITPCLQNRKTGFVDFLEPDQIGVGSTEFIVLRSRPGIPKQLSYFLATDPTFRDFAIRHMVGTSGRQRVSAADISTYTLPAPDSGWLAQFARLAADRFSYMKSMRDENRTLAATRDALLPLLMSGKLRVRDAEKVLGEVL
nr:restriction endonuclease subunit S [Leifsonia psychrotolerans]